MGLANTSLARRALLLLFIGGVITGSGCNKSGVGKTVPVSGKVTVGGQPLTKGTVRFFPNAEKGNSTTVQPFATVGADGNYTLKTDGKEGAPLGWYKVVVSTRVPPGADVPQPAKDTPPKDTPEEEQLSIDPKYASVTTTDQFIEVVDAPAAGAYDLKLVK